MSVEVAQAMIPRPGKDEDTALVRRLDPDGGYLLAVADGLSLNGGGAAARWVHEHLAVTTHTGAIRQVFQALTDALAAERGRHPESETTLTCVLLHRIGDAASARLHLEFFAIGDSPIWKVVQGEGRYPFQRLAIHGPPFPTETARVYATVRLHLGDIKGAVSFGSAEVAADEVLVLCSDGIPEREVFVRDLRRDGVGAEGCRGLCTWLFDEAPFRDDSLARVLATYDREGLLFDDATLIAVRAGRSMGRIAVDEEPSLLADEPQSTAPAEVPGDEVRGELESLDEAPTAIEDEGLVDDMTSAQQVPPVEPGGRAAPAAPVSPAEPIAPEEPIAAPSRPVASPAIRPPKARSPRRSRPRSRSQRSSRAR